jgi:hypothetical protein
MKDRTGNTAGRKPRLAVVGQDDVGGAVRAAFADRGQVLLPILELIETARTSIDELMNEAARGFVEQLLVLSAQEVAGAKHPGRREGGVLWHGSQSRTAAQPIQPTNIVTPSAASDGSAK